MNETVTVLIVSYNPRLEQLRKTVKSIILQRGIDVEIIISDDGSSENYFGEIKDFLIENNFYNFKLIGAENNQGTCKNILKGLAKSSGLYVKTIAPGDYLFDEFVLKKWINFMREKHIDVSFGDSVYYQMDADKINSIRILENPQLCDIYDFRNFSYKKAVLDYILLKDTPNGASFIIKRSLLIEYMKIIENEIIYAEDMIYRIMLTNKIKIIHYSKPVILYEFGTGISTSGSEKWGKIISNERKISNKLIKKNNKWKGIDRIRLCKCLTLINEMKSDFVKYLIFPELLFMKIKKLKTKRYTNCKMDLTFFYKL